MSAAWRAFRRVVYTDVTPTLVVHYLSVGTRASSLVKLTTASKGREMRNNPSLSPSPEYDLSYLSKIWKSSFPLHREDFKSSFLFQRSVRHAGDLSPRCLFFLSPPGVGFVGSTKPLPRLLCPVPLQPGSRVGFLSHIHWLAAVFAVVVHGLAVRAVGAVSATLLPPATRRLSVLSCSVSQTASRLSAGLSGRPLRHSAGHWVSPSRAVWVWPGEPFLLRGSLR